MGNARGVKRDFVELERRRFEALEMLNHQGFNQTEVARRIKVSSQTVSRWAKTVSAEGQDALLATGPPGRRPGLDEGQRTLLFMLLLEGTHRLGLDTKWTNALVARLIEKEFRVRYHPGHVSKLLRQMNWDEGWREKAVLKGVRKTIAEWEQTVRSAR
jgi:transposase